MSAETGFIAPELTPTEAQHLDDLLDEALRDSFPASDPVAISVERNPEVPDGNSVARPNNQSTQAGYAP